MPLKRSGSLRRLHICSKWRSDLGGRALFQSYATSKRSPHFGQAMRTSSGPQVVPQAGRMQRWKANSARATAYETLAAAGFVNTADGGKSRAGREIGQGEGRREGEAPAEPFRQRFRVRGSGFRRGP